MEVIRVKKLISLIKSEGYDCNFVPHQSDCGYCSKKLRRCCRNYINNYDKVKFDIAKDELGEIDPELLMELLL